MNEIVSEREKQQTVILRGWKLLQMLKGMILSLIKSKKSSKTLSKLIEVFNPFR